ncbi:hypothetical protein CLU79DRAFT_839158 [Phycomyces nitens]|nr:hypothetical protein CLU79DRAFT_839158 [Phycomyces nitens]
MYKRPSRPETPKDLQDHSSSHKIKAHPLQAALSSLPQLAISLAVLFVIIGTNTTYRQPNIVWLTLASTGCLCLGSVFIYLQINNANYKHWKAHSWTRQAIQIASIAFIITLPSSHFALWPVYGWTTPLVVIPAFVVLFTCLHIGTAFLSL